MNSLAFFIGWRFKQGRKRRGMVSLVSIISTLSIALGIIALIVGLSAMNGFEHELRSRVLAVIPHGKIASPFGEMQDWSNIAHDLEQQPNITAVSPYINFTGLIENGKTLKAVSINGVIPELEQQTSALPQYVLDDGWQRFSQHSDQMIIGVGLAKELGAKQGDWVTLLVPNSTELKQPKRIRMQIAGLTQLSGKLGYNFVLIPLTAAQNYTNMGKSVTGLAVNVTDVMNANHVVINAARQLHLPLSIMTWENEYGYMYRDIQMIRSIMYLAMILVIGVSCFNIVSTLIIAVKDKNTDIAILKTLGADNRLIRQIFIWYGLMSGVIGSLVGVTIGILIALNLSDIVSIIESLIGHKVLDGHIYFIDFLPSQLHINDIILVFCTAIILSLIASYYPAKRACGIDPAKALNGM